MGQRKTSEEKRLEREANRAFEKVGFGLQFDVWDLGKITDAGVEAGKAGKSVEEAVRAACQQYKKN